MEHADTENLQKENEALKAELDEYKNLLYSEQVNSITDLPTFTLFFAKTKKLLDDNPNTNFVFIKMNIDRFQLVNIFFGYEEGNRLLAYFSQKLKQLPLIIPKCIIGHLGGDSFAVCCSAFSNNGIVPLIKKYISPISTSFRDDYILTISVGIYNIEDNTLPLNTIHSKTAVALSKSKNKYGKNFTIFEENMNKDLINRQMVLNEVKIAYAEKQFQVYLQPKCNLENGKVVGAEALIRWHHPDRGIIPPDNFIPTLEDTGLISKIDEYVWNVSCKYVRSWIDSGIDPIPVSVNISRIDLHNPDLPKILLGIVQKNNIPIEYLRLEITESAYSDYPEQILETVNNLHNAGFRIELDDFGTGYSSLSTLNVMKLDTLKLDMSFIQSENKKQREIIKFIVNLAKTLDLNVVAEGIETPSNRSFLHSVGCDTGQGYLFSKAIPKYNFDEYLKKQNIVSLLHS